MLKVDKSVIGEYFSVSEENITCKGDFVEVVVNDTEVLLELDSEEVKDRGFSPKDNSSNSNVFRSHVDDLPRDMKINSHVVNVEEILEDEGLSDLDVLSMNDTVNCRAPEPCERGLVSASVDDFKMTIDHDTIKALGERGYENMGTDLYDGDVYLIFEHKPMGAIYA